VTYVVRTPVYKISIKYECDMSTWYELVLSVYIISVLVTLLVLSSFISMNVLL
jgi:hypothetical protein